MSISFPIRLTGGLAVALVALHAAPAAAQTSADLRTACQNSPGHVVVVTQAVKILGGPRFPATEQVSTPCTIVLGPDGKLEMEDISMTFAGPLVVEGPQKNEIKLSRTHLSAPSIALRVPGISSAIELTSSRVVATMGDLSLTVGDEGALSVMGQLPSAPQESLEAAATIQLRGGRKLVGQLGQARISAPRGVTIAMTGAEALLKVSDLWITAELGSIAIAASGTKGAVEMKSTNLVFGTASSIRLAGAESIMKLERVGMKGAGPGPAPGGLVLEAGAGANADGRIEASEVSFFDVASITVRASVAGQKGGVQFQKSAFNAAGNIVFETGALGNTEVKESYGDAGTLLRVTTGAGGSCTSQLNSIVAPISRVCP